MTGDGASDYASAMLRNCGVEADAIGSGGADEADVLWAESGAMTLSGRAEGPPELAPGPLALAAQGAGQALRALAADSGALSRLDAAALLAERAAIAGLQRQGATSPGGHCRLLRAADDWLAVNLPRPDDEALLAAWLQASPISNEPCWDTLTRVLPERSGAELIERARLLGLPVASVARRPTHTQPWLRTECAGRPTPPKSSPPPRVLDLSTLWAGPLCTHLLQLAGAEVIKLESPAREDGARRGPADFFDLLNAGKRCAALDLSEREGIRLLEALIDSVDIVVESARPRALAQLGIDVRACLARRPGLTWLSITGYGRRDPEAQWVAFGDDAAAAAGASIWQASPGANARPPHDETPLFCGDAIADPLTGLHAAVAALASHRTGGGRLLDVSLRAVTAYALAWPTADASPPARVEAAQSGEARWQLRVGHGVHPVRAPRARTPAGRAAALGADTGSVLEALAGPT
jgi:crotonobetainyl-CoA:carnitine CoA-transferase CaiB-like acyl-CoA transferase